MATIYAAALVSLLGWRLWRFTIWPLFHPEEPRELPYWIPFLGHLASFFLNYDRAISEAIKHFNYTKEPFSVTLLGQTLYIVTDARDAAEIYKDSKSFSRDVLVHQLYSKVGISRAAIKRLFRADPQAPYNLRNAKALDPTDEMMAIYHQHLSPGLALDSFLDRDVIPRVQAALQDCEETTASLRNVCSQAFIKGFVASYYGGIIFDIEPEFVKWYLQWEELSWKLIYGLPGFLSKDMLTAKGKLVDAFLKYFSLPPEQRGHSNFWTDSVERSLRDVDLSNEDVARVFTMQTWGFLGNAHKVAFWLVAHLVNDRSLLNSINMEVAPATRGGRRLDHRYLADECPKLDALFDEVLRLTVTSPLLRGISSTSTIGGKKMQEGNQVLVVYRQLHFDSTVWGRSPQTLQSNRFLDDKALKSNLAYRPWGGGKTLCPGRFFARKAIFAFVACLLGHYEIHVDGAKPFPRADLTKPTPGSAAVADGDDILLHLSAKSEQ